MPMVPCLGGRLPGPACLPAWWQAGRGSVPGGKRHGQRPKRTVGAGQFSLPLRAPGKEGMLHPIKQMSAHTNHGKKRCGVDKVPVAKCGVCGTKTQSPPQNLVSKVRGKLNCRKCLKGVLQMSCGGGQGERRGLCPNQPASPIGINAQNPAPACLSEEKGGGVGCRWGTAGHQNAMPRKFKLGV